MSTYSWYLKIAGVQTRYWSGGAPSHLHLEDQPPGGTVAYRDYEGIISVGPQTANLDPLGGIAEHGNVQVVLRAGGDSADDPARVFRLDRPTPSVRLAITVGSDDALGAGTRLDTQTSPAGWPTNADGYYELHIGQEMMIAASLDVAGPTYGFLAPVRAVARTFQRSHVVDATKGLYPAISSTPCTWRGRRAWLDYAGSDGVVRHYASGYLVGPPALAEDGLTVSLSIAPLTAVLDQTIGDSATTRLLQGWHYFTAGCGDKVRRLDCAPAGSLYRDLVTVAAGGGMTGVQTDATGTHRLTLVSDFTAPWSDGRLVRIWADGWGPGIPVDSEVAGLLGLASPGETPTALAVGQGIVNASCWSLHEHTIAAGLQAWPDVLVAGLNGDTGWGSPDATPGAVTSWAKVTTTQREDGTWDIRHRLTSVGTYGGIYAQFRNSWAGPAQEWLYGQSGPGVHTGLHYGFSFYPPDAGWYDSRRRGDGWTGPPEHSDQSHYPVQMPASWGDADVCTPIRGAATAYYQTGEPGFLCETDIFQGATPHNAWVRIAWEEGGEPCLTWARVASVAAEGTGYYYTLAPGCPVTTRSFGDWGGQRATITACPVMHGLLASDVIVALLMSGGSTAVLGSDGTDIRLPYGAGLTPYEVDRDGIWAGQGGDSMRWDFALEEAATLRDVVEPILRAGSLILRQAGDPIRLELSSIGATTTPTSALADAGIGAAMAVRTLTRDKVVCVVDLACNFQAGEPQIVGRFVDASAQAEAGGNAGSPVKLVLWGSDVASPQDAIAQYLPVAQAITWRLGQARREWQVAVPWPPPFGLGDNVALTLAGAVGLDGVRGISTVGRVVSLEQRPSDAYCVATFAGYPGQGSGWAPGSIVVASTGASSLTLQDGVGAHLAVGDAIWCWGAGDFANRVTRVIATVAGDVITTTAPHGIAAGDQMRVREWVAVSGRLRGYCYCNEDLTWA